MARLKFDKTLKETHVLNAWLWKEHQTDPQWLRVRLGQLPTNEMAKAYMVLLRWADAIFLKDGIVHIVEAKLNAEPGAFGQLDLYAELFRATPAFDQYKNWPIQKILLSARLDLNIADLAGKKEVQYIVFTHDEVNKVRSEIGQQVI